MKSIYVGIAGGSAQRCLDAVKNAVKKAEWPNRLAFGICPGDHADPTPFFKAAGFAACRLMTGKGLSPKAAWQTVYSMYGGQEFALQVTPEAFFLEDWDRSLLASFHEAADIKPLLTGALSLDAIPRAVAVRGFHQNGQLQISPGAKVLNASKPPRSFFLSPDFVFGPGEWMRAARENDWDGTGVLSLTLPAFGSGFKAFVPHLKSMGRLTPPSFPEESLPPGDWESILAEFEEDSGVFTEKREADLNARLGIYTPDGRYPVQLSMADGLRQLILRRKETPIARVMLATAFGKHAPRLPQDVHLTLFENMAELKRLSLCCYCPQDKIRLLQKIMPNTYARQEGEDGLPAFGSEDAFLRSKPYFIAEASYQFPSHTHYGWIDMDYVKHPVPQSAVFLWDALTDDKIHLAQVNGEVDTGLVVVPREKIGWLLETASVLNPTPEMGPQDAGLFKCMADTYPDAFCLHPMGKKHMLLSLCQPLISGGMLYDA
jgi:hypothetical protein